MMIELPIIETEKVELFVLKPEHVSDRYVLWLNEPEINKYLESRFQIHTLGSVQQFVASCLDRSDTILFGIRSKSLGGLHVGNIKIGPIDQHHGLAEIGLLIGERSAWGQGIATDAIKAVSDLAFTKLAIRKITAGCYASNIGSKRAFEKAGFRVEGIRERHFIFNNNHEALILLGLWGGLHSTQIEKQNC